MVKLGKANDNDPDQFCNALLKLHQTKPAAGGMRSWLTTRAITHLKEHPIDSTNGKKFALAARQREGEAMGQQMQYGMPAPNGEGMVGTDSLATFKLTKKERSLSAQAQWYVYSTMQISKSEFNSVWFRKMLMEVGDGDATAILSQPMLISFVRAEFKVFIIFLKLLVRKKREIAKGNAFAQALDDGGTLVSKRKYQALALQFIAPEWRRNLVVTVGLIRSMHNKDSDVANVWEVTIKARTGFTFTEIVARRRSDRAAKGVAGALGCEEEEVCEMHDTDKMGRAATGALVRTRKKVVVNPFAEGVALVSRAHKLGT
jgi:hypothetical protein